MTSLNDFSVIIEKHQAIILLLDAEVVAQDNFHKLADHVAHQARFEYRPVFPILLEPCEWDKSSLQHIPIYPLNRQPINQWTPPEAAWNQVADEIWDVLKPYTAFYPETDRAKALRSIGKVAVGTNQSFVSGFLISPDVLLTSNLQIISKERAAQATLGFTDAGGLTATFTLAPDRFFLTDAETGVSFVSVNETPTQSDYHQARTIGDYYTLKLASEPVKSGDQLDATNFDRAQQLRPNTQTVDFADDDHIQYQGPIIPGASGGPLLNQNLEVVTVNPSHRERSDYEMLSFDIQARTVAESSARVQTIAALFRQINQDRTAKDWTDANGNRILSELFQKMLIESFTQETDNPTEVFTTIPQNRTLIALKLTDEPPLTPTIENGLDSISAVFDWFKPAVEIEFLGENSLEIEKLVFNTLDDFGPVGIERKSKVLKKLTAQRQDKENSIRRNINQPSIKNVISTEREQRDIFSKLIKQNLKKALEVTRDLEISYRSLALFYENAGAERVENVSILNADMEQLQDLDNPIFFDAIANELRQNYDTLDLRNSYSLLVVPENTTEKWAQLAYQNKVVLLTDNPYLDLGNKYKLVGENNFLCNVIMTCNYLLGRESFMEVGEKALYLPPSCAMAGKLYSQKILESINQLTGLQKLQFEMTKQQIAQLEEVGLIPLFNSSGYAKASSTRTLYSGEDEALRMYPTVRVFDWLTKVFMDFLNSQPLENWTYSLEKDMRQQIELFLTSIKGPDKIIAKYTGLRLERDPSEKDRVLFGIDLKLSFSDNYFWMLLARNPTDTGFTWNTSFGS